MTAPPRGLDELAVVQDRDAEPLEPREVEDALVLVHGLADERRGDREPDAGTRLRQHLGRVEAGPAAAPVGHEHRPETLSGARIASQASTTATPGGGVSSGR